MKLRHKITALIVLVILCSLGASLFMVERRLTADVFGRTEQNLAYALAGFRRSEQKRSEILEMLASGLEQNASLRAVLHTNDYATLQYYLKEVQQEYRVSLILLTDRDGRSLLRTDVPGEKGKDLTAQEPVAVALSGNCYSGYWSDLQLYQVVAVPLIGARNRVEGTLALGYRLDRKLADEIASDTGSVVTISTSRALVAADTHSLGGNLLLKLVQRSGPDKVSANAVPFRVQINTGYYSGLLAPLGTLGQKPVAYITLMHDLGVTLEAVRQARAALLTLGLGAFLAAIFISTPVVRRITHGVELFQTVVHNVGDGLCHMDCDLKVQLLNPAAEQALGILSDRALGQDLLDLATLSGSEGPLARETLLSTLSDRQILRQEEGNILAPRRHASFHASFALAPVIEGGRVSGVVLTFRDISPLVAARQRAEEAVEQLRHAQDELVQANKMSALGRLAGGICHDFNNLLTVIQGYCDLLVATLDPDDSRSQDVGEIARATNQAAWLTAQLLAFTRKQVLRPGMVDLDTVIGGTAKMIQRVLGEDIELVTSLQSGGCVLVDVGQIERVVMNLVVNARDAMPRGGRLTLKTSRQTVGADRRVRGVPTGEYVVFTVEDNGCGMAEETLAHLFEPFFTTKPMDRGVGLGLSTVHGIIQQSEGFIDVQSQPGEGTSFDIYLPWRGPSPELPVGSESEATQEDGPCTVLVVEDDLNIRSLLKRILHSSGFTVLEAQDGIDAIGVSARHAGPIQLLVSDVVMPRMCGPEVASQLILRRPDLKVLFMSGYTDEHVAHHGLAGQAFLAKPFTPALFIQQVYGALSTR